MSRVSVITPSVRPESLEIVRRALNNQEFKDFEWLIGSSFDPEIAEARWIKDDFSGGFWSLNRIYNRLIKNSHGDIIVTWQDWIYADQDALKKFVEVINKTNYKSLIASSGHQYARLNKYGKPELKIWEDPRRNLSVGSFYEIFPQDFEWNFGAIPKKALIDVGGFCEDLDFSGYGMDGYQVNERLDLIGYKFHINHDIESFTLRHNRDSYGGEEKWNKDNNLHNGGYEKVKNELKLSGNWPVIKK